MSEGPIAFLGLGRMGRLMAANLRSRGFDLVVYNRTSASADQFAARHGGRVAPTVAEALSGTGVAITMLADGEALTQVYGEAGDIISPGFIAIDMGTSGTSASASVRELLATRNATLVDAPVSGSTPAAEAGTLLIMAGAEPATFDKVRPILEAMGKPELVGPPGAGAALKLAVNSILHSLNQAFAEAVALANSAGVPPEVTQDVVSRSAAGAPMISYRKAQYLDPEHSPVTFTLDLSAKDLRLTLEAAAGAGVDMWQLQRTLETVEALLAQGLGERDMGYVVRAALQPGS